MKSEEDPKMKKFSKIEVQRIKKLLKKFDNVHSSYFEFENTSLIVNFKDDNDDISDYICVDAGISEEKIYGVFSAYAREIKLYFTKVEDFEVTLEKFLDDYYNIF